IRSKLLQLQYINRQFDVFCLQDILYFTPINVILIEAKELSLKFRFLLHIGDLQSFLELPIIITRESQHLLQEIRHRRDTGFESPVTECFLHTSLFTISV
ncbi:hypothetical protein ALC56_13077, partial [Trachymyrmex septentrionalis]